MARLPLEQGAAFEQAIWNIAKPQRATRQAGRQRARLAAVRSGRARHTRAARQRGGATAATSAAPTTLIVQRLSDDARAAARRRWSTRSAARDSRATRLRRPAALTIKPSRPRPRALACRRVAPPDPQQRALHKRSSHCQYPGCDRRPRARGTPRRAGRASECAGLSSTISSLLCPPPPQAAPRPPHTRRAATPCQPMFVRRRRARLITDQAEPHAPPRMTASRPDRLRETAAADPDPARA